MSKHIILGSPGTGKTFTLINKIEELLAQGYSTKDICFCTFTKAAAIEAKERVMKKFNLIKEDIPYFGTIHSLCFRRYLSTKKVIKPSQIEKVFKYLGLEYKKITNDEDLITQEAHFNEEGNVLLSFYDHIRIVFFKKIQEYEESDLKQLFFNLQENNKDYSILFSNNFNPYKVLLYYEEYKQQNNLIDYVDMLLICLHEQYIVPTKILIIDEFQDLNPLQYTIYRLWCMHKEYIYLAGDDDQTIYKFIQATPKFLFQEIASLDESQGDTKEVLKITYRMAETINTYCHEYIQNNLRGKRETKQVNAVKEGGEIREITLDYDLGNILAYIRQEKFSFVLFRTNYQKKVFIDEVLIPQGVIYHEIRGEGLWNKKTINIFNALIKIITQQPLTYLEVKYLVKAIPFKVGLLEKGAKTRFDKEQATYENYTIQELISLGFKMQIFTFTQYEQWINILDIKDPIKRVFETTKKEIIQYPFKLRIGTIHSAKGKEVDDVLICKDISKKISNEIQKSDSYWDDEIRVFYVGQSRPRERLIIFREAFSGMDEMIIP